MPPVESTEPAPTTTTTTTTTDLTQYYQYHNRLASFHAWDLAWELEHDKPAPEALARAGFYHAPGSSTAAAAAAADTCVCPLCGLVLDQWEPDDDPARLHRERSADVLCAFVGGGNVPVRDMGGGRNNSTTSISTSTSSKKKLVIRWGPAYGIGRGPTGLRAVRGRGGARRGQRGSRGRGAPSKTG